MPTDSNNPPSRTEMVGRVVYSLLGPAVRMARAFSVPLRDIGRWCELAYFRELRTAEKTIGESAERLDVSRRKASELSRMLKENFFEPERVHGLARQIEFMVWAEPLSLARIKQTLEAGEADIEYAIDSLLEEGRIVKTDDSTPVYEIARGESRLVEDEWLAKIDALNQLLDTIVNAIYARFFEDDSKALARNLQFHIRPEDLGQLRELYEEHIWPTLRDLDQRAADDNHRIPMDFSVAWAPHQYIEDSIDDE